MSTLHYSVRLPRTVADIACILGRHQGTVPLSAIAFEIARATRPGRTHQPERTELPEEWDMIFSKAPEMPLDTIIIPSFTVNNPIDNSTITTRPVSVGQHLEGWPLIKRQNDLTRCIIPGTLPPLCINLDREGWTVPRRFEHLLYVCKICFFPTETADLERLRLDVNSYSGFDELVISEKR